jgi:hypothetical protein
LRQGAMCRPRVRRRAVCARRGRVGRCARVRSARSPAGRASGRRCFRASVRGGLRGRSCAWARRARAQEAARVIPDQAREDATRFRRDWWRCLNLGPLRAFCVLSKRRRVRHGEAKLTRVKGEPVTLPGDVEDRGPVSPHPSIGTLIDPPADLPVQIFALPSVHCDVARERVQERDVLLG